MSTAICGWHLHCFVKLQPVCMCSIITSRLPGLFLCGWLLFRASLGFVYVRHLLSDSNLASFSDSRSVSLSHLSFQLLIHPLLSLHRCHCLPFSIFLPLYSATALAFTAYGFLSFLQSRPLLPSLFFRVIHNVWLLVGSFILLRLRVILSFTLSAFFFSIIHEHRCSFSTSVWNPSPVPLFLVSIHGRASF